MKKLILMCTVCALLLGCTLSCKPEHGADDTTGKSDVTNRVEEPANRVDLIRDGTALLRVAFAQGEAPVADSAIRLLGNAFSNLFGVSLPDAVVWEASMADGPCIVFGNTGDTESEEVYRDMRNRDYQISVLGNRISIAAFSEDSYAMAANALVNNLKKIAGNSKPVRNLSLASDYSASYKGRYTIMSATVEGIDLRELSVLEPSDPDIRSEFADQLSVNLSDAYGYEIGKTDGTSAGLHCIRLAIDRERMEPMEYGYYVKDGDLIVVSGGAYSMKYAAQDIAALLRPDSSVSELSFQNGDSAKVSLLDHPDGLPRAGHSDLRVMSANVTASFEGWDSGSSAVGYSLEMRGEIFESYLKVYDPDVVGMQEVCNNWHDYLNDRYGEGSEWAIATGGGTRMYFLNPIMYRADRFRLIDQGWQNFSRTDSQAWGGRYMCWVLLESIATGEQFALINVHCSGLGASGEKAELNRVQFQEIRAKINDLHSAHNCQVMVTGDYNTRDFIGDLKGDAKVPNPDISDSDYTYMVSDGGVKDAKFYTDVLVNDIGSVHGWGGAAFARVYSFDHIFVTSDTTVRQFYTAWDNHQNWLTDHAFLIADIDLSVTKAST